jgi:subtilase family serine protease
MGTAVCSNTNTSMSTEEGAGFGLAMLDFVTELASREAIPHVLSLSLGSLSAVSCDKLCDEAAKSEGVQRDECEAYLQKQRQVCMFESPGQVSRINQALMSLGLRGVSILGSSGDGGSHWSFGPFSGFGKVPRALNKIGCEFQFPIFPSPSPYMVSVGGTEWEAHDPSHPVMWSGSGGGFSWQFGRPAHQDDAVKAYLTTTEGLPPSESFNASGRAYPDISAVAVMGTSQSSPTFAGIFTQLVDARLNAGLKPLGPLAPRIWHIATAFPGEAFEDVTEGNSKTSCSNGFPATKGWDPTTGWGRPVWAGLLKHFGSDASLQGSLHGAP